MVNIGKPKNGRSRLINSIFIGELIWPKIFEDEGVTAPSMYELCSFNIRLASMDVSSILRHLKLRPAFTLLEKFENPALFLQRGLLPKINRHENGAFRNHCSHKKNGVV